MRVHLGWQFKSSMNMDLLHSSGLTSVVSLSVRCAVHNFNASVCVCVCVYICVCAFGVAVSDQA